MSKKFKPKDIGITKKQLKNPLNSTFEKVKELDQQGKNQVMTAMWKGIGPLKGFEAGYQEIKNNLNKIKNYWKTKESFNINKTKKQLLESWSTGFGVPKKQKTENFYFQTIIKEMFADLENKTLGKKVIKELEKDLEKSEEEMKMSLARKLQIIRKNKKLK
jgi:protein subunit release factor A